MPAEFWWRAVHNGGGGGGGIVYSSIWIQFTHISSKEVEVAAEEEVAAPAGLSSPAGLLSPVGLSSAVAGLSPTTLWPAVLSPASPSVAMASVARIRSQARASGWRRWWLEQEQSTLHTRCGISMVGWWCCGIDYWSLVPQSCLKSSCLRQLSILSLSQAKKALKKFKKRKTKVEFDWLLTKRDFGISESWGSFDNIHDSALHPAFIFFTLISPLFAFTLILPLFDLLQYWLIPKKGKKSYEFEEWDSWRQNNGILCRWFHYSHPYLICHYFYTHIFWGLEILHSKVRIFATKNCLTTK